MTSKREADANPAGERRDAADFPGDGDKIHNKMSVRRKPTTVP